MEQKYQYKINIRGRVQGVGYRWSAFHEANLRGITGFVRNQRDGSVYIEAEGTRDQLDPFVEWCRQGPGRSIVNELTVEKFPPVNYSDFHIEH